MAVGSLLFLAVLVIVHHPLRVSDKQDQATVQRAQQQEQRLALEMTRLELECEQRNQAKRPGPHQSLGPHQSQGEDGVKYVAWDRWRCMFLLIILLFELCMPSLEPKSSYDSSSEDASSEEEEDDAEAGPWCSCTRHPDCRDRMALWHCYE
ncbi:inositol 1,4,5-trisphosphate receptor-interacting protein-like 1 [Mauremys mutica]|uniref:Uncharacterized protein n=1 Tax=Mauremys mutica TaxID=74926 RepID=A0A9D4AXN9_9SAUR|nr:inositol 1,4,5-trisphosphate receptor-interacting protein-like 1 [Mauremys mutica]KAH1172591.1 hypothetical protein KIL84_016430 [Mauremys mutica]